MALPAVVLSHTRASCSCRYIVCGDEGGAHPHLVQVTGRVPLTVQALVQHPGQTYEQVWFSESPVLG